MAFCFGDGFDSYATMADPILGYWDSGLGVAGANTLVAGRFAGSQAVSIGSAVVSLVKNSGANDTVHHFVCAFRQTSALSGTTLGLYFQLSDGATNQVCVVFRSDGAMLLTSATPSGTVLDTYTGAVSAANTWFAFEIEITINNTTGSWAVRKNGNTVNDRATGSLNTRPGANAYANKLTLGMQAIFSNHQVDDILWRSDASSVPWIGDVRCYTRMPVSDVTTTFARTPNTTGMFNNTSSSLQGGPGANQVWFVPVTPTFGGSATAALASFAVAVTGQVNMALYDNNGLVGTGVFAAGSPGALLAQGAPITNPGTGLQTFTFGTPVTVTRGVQYWVAIFGNASMTSAINGSSGILKGQVNFTYSGGNFPASGAGAGSVGGNGCTYVGFLMAPGNYSTVNETLQDGTTSYVYSSNPTDADFYTVAPLAGTPAAVIAVVTRGLLQKSDAGARGAAVQLKSGGVTVATTPTLLGTSFGWLYRTDTVDPATGLPWTAAAVNNVQIGPVVSS